MKRAWLLVLASAVSWLGWGAILPYQYAYAANTRGWGVLVAAAASSLFSIGALVAAPIGGRLADRFDPVRVVVVAQLVAAVASALLILAGTPVLFLFGMFVFGAGITAAIPVQTILVLRWVDAADRRRVFALLFTGNAVGMAIGAFTAGFIVDLKAMDGMWPAFATGAIGYLVSAVLTGIAGHMPSMALRSTMNPAVKAPMAMPTAEPVNRSAKTRRRSAASTHRSTRIVWTGIAAVIPAPKTNMPNRKSTGVPASMSNALATAATSWATTTTRTGSKRSASSWRPS